MILTGQTQFLDNKWLHPTTPQDTNSCKLNIKNERLKKKVFKCYTKQQNNDSEPTMLKSILIY